MQLKLDQKYQHVIKKLETYKTEQTRFHEHTQYRLNSAYLSTPFHRILNLSYTHIRQGFMQVPQVSMCTLVCTHKFSGSAEQRTDSDLETDPNLTKLS